MSQGMMDARYLILMARQMVALKLANRIGIQQAHLLGDIRSVAHHEEAAKGYEESARKYYQLAQEARGRQP